MFSEIDIMGFPGLSPCRRPKEFAITAEGFIPLCEKEYEIIAIHQPYFAKSLPKSAWVYFCVMSLYAHLVTLKQEEGNSSDDEDAFASQVLSGKYQLPAPIEAYIRALGNVVGNNSVTYKLSLPAWPNETGDFGRMAANSHWKYSSMPCPLICRQRIQEDLRVTTVPGIREWNLPPELCPVEEEAGVPTRNCLGWALATSLTNVQVEFLKSVNILENAFPIKSARFQFSTDLCERVSLAIMMTKGIINIVPLIKRNTEGALGLMCWTAVEPVEHETSTDFFYSECRKNQIIMSTEIDRQNVAASLILSCRVRKDQIGNTRPYSPYAFAAYTKVPDEWHATRNFIFEYGCVDRWNVKEYTTPFMNKSEYRSVWLESYVK